METQKNGYIAMYKGKKIEVYAETIYKAQQIAATIFKTKKSWDVIVVLCEKGGNAVVHSADF